MTTILSDLLATITERGLTLLESNRRQGRVASADELLDRCEELLSSRGEAAGIARASDILDCYSVLDTPSRLSFFEGLASRFGADLDAVAMAADAFRDQPAEEAAVALHYAAEPRRQELIRRLNRAPGGTAALVTMRADLLRTPDTTGQLALVDRDFRHLLGSWFNRGFLLLQRVSWRTPANILEKIIRYEAVHEINGWDDLRQRVDAADRRLYAFFHPALAEEPLVFLEVALADSIPDAIGPILAADRLITDPERASVAVFYAISNCQPGLRGVSFGSFLIKQVVEELRAELPHLKTFVTLSPVPGLAAWHDARAGGAAPEEGRDLAGFAARYLTTARRDSGEPADPVARFHLGNGARLEAIHPNADMSAKGMAQSFGVMVNYLYDPATIERHHEAYANGLEIATGPAVKKLLRGQPRLRQEERDNV